jgi:phospholipid/cholesterol/gamma-HCH transport system permease protein
MTIKDSIRGFFFEIAEITNFTVKTVINIFKRPFEFEEFIKQSYRSGYKTLPLITVTALIMGLVLTIQTRPVLLKLGAESWLPGMVFISVIREMGPVITALIFAGKVGSGIGAEINSMRVTEQIDAMEVSGTYPMKYLVATRVLAATLMLPLLVIYADFIALLGSYIGFTIRSNVSLLSFFNQAFSDIDFFDIVPATVKTIFFGFGIGIVSCYKGYFLNKGTEGVGIAANSAVVISSLVIFIIDLIVVQITDLIT